METRRVSLLVGRKSYNILTPLDEDTLKEVYEILHDAASATDPAMEQDERLFLVAMNLANEIAALTRRVKTMTDLIEDGEPEVR